MAEQTGWVRAALTRCGPTVVEINAVFAVPYVAPPWGGHDHIRYECEATGPNGPVYLRSHGWGFNILPKPWLGQRISGCYSIGPGLADGKQRTVVLAQLFRGAGDVLDVLAADRRWATKPLLKAGQRYGLPCLLFSGYL